MDYLKKNQSKKRTKNDMNQLRLIREKCDLSHKIEITL